MVRLSASASSVRSRLKPEPRLVMIRMASFSSRTPMMLLTYLDYISCSSVGTICNSKIEAMSGKNRSVSLVMIKQRLSMSSTTHFEN